MIRIIKHGNKKRVTCSYCGCIFTYEKEDVVVKDYGRNDVAYTVSCPDCGADCIASPLK